MHLSSLHLTQFKNYAGAKLDFSPRLNAFLGANGAGKTNLLEAIYYLCIGKTYGVAADQYSIRHGDAVCRLDGTFTVENETNDRVVVKLRKRGRKVIERNGVAYDRLAEHVGRYPVVIIVPDDSKLVMEGSETRRRLIDNSLSQTDPEYLRQLMTYNKVLAQRNALLKKMDGLPDSSGLLDVYDAQLSEPAQYVFERRQAFVGPFTEKLKAAYAAISGNREEVGVSYKTQLLDNSMGEILEDRADKDRFMLRTTGGIHRDDLLFTQGGHPLRRVASQGQLKSFVLALKLAQYRLVEAQTQRRPLLLLDDIFDKLDRDRVRQLLDLVLAGDFGQVFLSDTDPERVTALLTETAEWKSFTVADGSVTS